jgi:3-dehydroquinate dehydratase-2
MARNILIINGPNLNLLGTREPGLYGTTTLQDVMNDAQSQAKSLGIDIQDFQSNTEGDIVDRIQAAALSNQPRVDGIVINPGALTHTSVAVRDALLGVDIPFVEIHVTNVHAREPWRRHSYLSDKAEAVVCGLGTYGYTVGIHYLVKHFKPRNQWSKL